MTTRMLDDDTRRLLDSLAKTPMPDLLQLPPHEARIVVRQSLPPRDPALAVSSTDLEVGGASASPPVEIRVYRPDPPVRSKRMPAMLYLHGGGWLVGDLDTVDHVCRAIAHQARCVVVSVDYRLAPEHPFPAALEDAYAALCWLAATGGGRTRCGGCRAHRRR